jgi:hypothetical protein
MVRLSPHRPDCPVGVSIEEVSWQFSTGGVVVSRNVRRTWITASIVVLCSGLGELAIHLLASNIHEAMKPYTWVPWVALAVSVPVAVVAAVKDAQRTSAESQSSTLSAKRSVVVSGDANGVINTGDSNSITLAQSDRGDGKAE